MNYISSSKWQRVRRVEPCPICKHTDWCVVVGEPGCVTAAICARTESSRRAGDAGWLHRLRLNGPHRGRIRTITFAAESQHLDLGPIADSFVAAVEPDRLNHFASELGVTTNSLQRLNVGWAAAEFAFSFPMRNVAGLIVGIRLRHALSGQKWSVTGGREGLFMPSDSMSVATANNQLVICEGPTDTATLLDMGFWAVGRPNCTGGVKMLIELVTAWKPSDAVIMADADTPGQRGAETLAAVLLAYCKLIRIITPPAGIKDARAWRQAGATPADVMVRINAATFRKLNIVSKMHGGKHARTKH